MAFAGTLTLGAGTFLAAVGELCSSLVEHGFRRLLVVNGHGGNSALAARRSSSSPTARRCSPPPSTTGRSRARTAAEVPGLARRRDGARLRVRDLADAPPASRVRAARARRREIPEPRFSLERLELASPGPVAAGWQTDWLSSSGVLGAPDLASAEKGERLFEACVEGLTGLITELREAPLLDLSRAELGLTSARRGSVSQSPVPARAAEAMTLPQCAQSGGAQPWRRP